jgi:hypothetical protein
MRKSDQTQEQRCTVAILDNLIAESDWRIATQQVDGDDEHDWQLFVETEIEGNMFI